MEEDHRQGAARPGDFSGGLWSCNDKQQCINFVLMHRKNKKCFKCQGYRHFQANCPNRRVMTLQEMNAIDEACQEESGEEEREESESGEEIIVEEADNGEMLMFDNPRIMLFIQSF